MKTPSDFMYLKIKNDFMTISERNKFGFEN